MTQSSWHIGGARAWPIIEIHVDAQSCDHAASSDSPTNHSYSCHYNHQVVSAGLHHKGVEPAPKQDEWQAKGLRNGEST